jgi:hypothetical protein
MAGKTASKKSTTSKTSSSSSSSKKSALKVKDLSPKKDPRGGASDHSPKGGGRNSDY